VEWRHSKKEYKKSDNVLLLNLTKTRKDNYHHE